MTDVQAAPHDIDESSLPARADNLTAEVDLPLDPESPEYLGAVEEERFESLQELRSASVHDAPARTQDVEASRPPPLPRHPNKDRAVKDEHARWWQTLTDPQKRAWNAYRERGLDINDTEKRDLLRAALSLHPDREVAASVIADLRKPERARAEEIVLERDDPPALHPADAPTQPIEADLSSTADHGERRDDALRAATVRIDQLAKGLQAAQQLHSASYKALGLPELPKDSPRKKFLARASAPERNATTEGRPLLLQALDHRIRSMHRDIVGDPLWIAADYLERTTSVEKIEDRVRDNEGVQRAQKQYREAENRVRAAAKALDDHAPRSLLQWGVDAVRLRLESDDDRLRALHGKMKKASLGLHHAKRELEGAEREARDAATELNAQALEIRTEARSRRDELERPLRDALADRFIVERAIAREPVPQHLREALDHGGLTYEGERTIGGFEYYEFAAAGGGSYLADATELRPVTDKLELARGDRVLLRSDELGVRHLEREARGDAWPRSRTIEGQVVEIDKADSTVRGVKVRDFKSGQERWVRPRAGDDLGKDYSAPLLARLQVHDAVRVAPNAFQITPGILRERPSPEHQLGR